MSLIRRIPFVFAAVALALAALGNLLLPYSPVLRGVCGALSAFIVLLLVARGVVDFGGLKADLKTHPVLAVSPAFFMALMLLSVYLKPFAAAPAKALWFAALSLQLVVVAVFVARHVVRLDLSQVLPSWFIVFVGFVTASVTSPAFETQGIGRVLFYAGIAGYLGLLPVVVYRLAKAGSPPQPLLPTLAVFAAPPSLLLAGYLAVIGHKEPTVVYVLLAAATASLIYVLSCLPKILGLGFHPSFSALTFPFVITAVAVKQASAFLASTPAGSPVPAFVMPVLDVAASAIVVYVLLRYAAFLLAPQTKAA